MDYFVTGATGFIGRHLVERLLEREGTVHVLVRPGSRERLEALIAGWGAERPRRAGAGRPVGAAARRRRRRPATRCAAASATSSTSPRSTT